MSQNVLFVITLAIFLLIIIYVGVRSKKQVSDADDYILAGRGVGFWMNVVNVISIGFAGTAITLCPYFSMHYGVLGGMIGNFMTAGGYIIYGIVLGKVIRDSGAQTLPEWLEVRFDRKTRNVIAVCSIIGMTGILANNIMSIVTTVSAYTGWPTWVVLVGSFAVILSFAFVAGMWGISTSAFAQMIIGIVIVPTFLFLVMGKFGIGSVSNWPTESWITTGVTGITYASTLKSVTYPGFWAGMASSFGLVFGSSYYWTRLATCRDAKTGRNSFAVGGLLMFIIFYIPLCLMGIYAAANHPEAFTYFGGSNAPTAAYGFLASLFPAIIGCLTVIAAIAASVSTAATSLIGTTATVSRDVYQRMINKTATSEQKMKATKIIIWLVSILTLIMCAYPGGAATIFGAATAFLAPAALLVVLGIITPKFNAKGAMVGALCGLVVMLGFYILSLINVFTINNYVYLAIVGLAATVIGCIIGTLLGKPKYFGQKGWSVDPTASNREDVKLEAIDKDVLGLLRIGHSTMADIVDYLGADCGDIAVSIERLDRGGYLKRDGLRGSKLYHFSITEKGWNAAPAISAEEAALAKQNLSTEYVTVLQKVFEGGMALNAYAKEKKINSLRLSAIICHLCRVGYMTQNKGLSAAKYELTAKGSAAIKR